VKALEEYTTPYQKRATASLDTSIDFAIKLIPDKISKPILDVYSSRDEYVKKVKTKILFWRKKKNFYYKLMESWLSIDSLSKKRKDIRKRLLQKPTLE
jgi:hypothetical protein